MTYDIPKPRLAYYRARVSYLKPELEFILRAFINWALFSDRSIDRFSGRRISIHGRKIGSQLRLLNVVMMYMLGG